MHGSMYYVQLLIWQKKTDMTIIYVTHYAEEILPMFDRTFFIRNGYLYTQGMTKDLFNNATVRIF